MNNIKERILTYKIGKNKLVFTNGHRYRLKTKASMSSEFMHSQLYHEIFEHTRFLPDDVDVFLRIKALLLDITHHPNCPICGKKCKMIYSLKITDDMFAKTCTSSHCKMSYMSRCNHMTNVIRHKHSIAQKNAKTRFIRACAHILTSGDIYDIEQVKSELLSFISNRRTKNSPIMSDSDIISNPRLFNSIFKYTDFIMLPSKLHNKQDLNLNERIYCIVNNISKLKTCKYCNSPTKFISYEHGYATSCRNCVTDKCRETKCFPTSKEILASIDTKKYEVINFPKSFANDKLKVKCKKCGNISERIITNGKGKFMKDMPLCNVCEKYVSKEEKELRSFVSESYDGDIFYNSRKTISPYELDIVIKDKNIAIEFDGLHWHNDNVVDNNYHLNKTKLCEQQGIQLVHVFENEWMFKKEIVKSRLLNLLGKYAVTIYARKCDIREVDSTTSKHFQDDNHIQGICPSSVNLGLYFNDELISLMTFGKCRFDKKHEWELLRFCNKLGYHIPGAASKLLAHFEKTYKPKSLVSYADRRWSQGKVYKALGFIELTPSRPNYWYFTNGNYRLQSRIKYQKHKLKGILEKFDDSLSESANMKNNGFLKIYDCGNLVYEKTY